MLRPQPLDIYHPITPTPREQIQLKVIKLNPELMSKLRHLEKQIAEIKQGIFRNVLYWLPLRRYFLHWKGSFDT